jgi:carbonic anhydrase/acetyltransferase-like protein (isoleucine patch superfamily)
MNLIQPFRGHYPSLPKNGDYWLAPFSVLIGQVTLGAGASVWHGATVRADNEPIDIGAGTNIQENCVLHVDDGYPLTIAENCTIGHGAILHGCSIGAGTIIGMGAIVMNGAKLGRGCLIGAGAVITENREIPEGSLVVGSPGQVKRQLDEGAWERHMQSAESYARKAVEMRSAQTL